MQFGAVLPHNEIGTDAQAMKTWAQGVEALGATHILIYDHVLGADPDRPGGWNPNSYDKDVAFHEPLTTFAFIAAVTERVELMSTVLILPQRQTALVAKQAAQLAMLSGNRFKLGVGIGWNTVEYDALNENFRNRGKRQDEQVRLLRQLWEADSLDFTGDFHRVDRASINPRPTAPIPVWFGGSAPAALKRCAELGDGWIPLMGPMTRPGLAWTACMSIEQPVAGNICPLVSRPRHSTAVARRKDGSAMRTSGKRLGAPTSPSQPTTRAPQRWPIIWRERRNI